MSAINLDDLVNPARLPRVTLYGREIAVRPLAGAAAHRIAKLRATSGDSGEEMLGAVLDVVRASCPALTEDEVAALTVNQIAALMQVAQGQVALVEEMLAEQAEKN